MPIESIVQAALIAIVCIVGFLFLVFSMLLAGSLKKKRLIDTEGESDILGREEIRDPARDYDSPKEAREYSPEPSPTPEPEEIPIFEKYNQIYRLEILYWRGVSKPWWWNNYAEELLEYADEYFPKAHVNLYATYNSNSVGQDYNNPSYQRRIQSLRPKKMSKHPLVVINYSQEYIMIDSYAALEEFKDRIDAEWYRHYQFKKTYRDSPVSYTT